MATSRTGQMGSPSGSSADSEGSASDQNTEVKHSNIRSVDSLASLLGDIDTNLGYQYNFKQQYSCPVIDMRKTHRFGKMQFHRLKSKSATAIDLKIEVSQQFNAKLSEIHVIEEKGLMEEVLLKTIIVILPDNVSENCIYVTVEVVESLDNIHPTVICARFPYDIKIADAKKHLADYLGWRKLVFCKSESVIDDCLPIKMCNFKCLDKIQAIKQSTCMIDFICRPRPDVQSIYSMEIDVTDSARQVKQQFKEHFKDELEKQYGGEGADVHFCFQNKLIEKNKCIGLIMGRNVKEEKISVHFGSEDSVLVDLKYKSGRRTVHKMLIVPRETSTMSLRTKVAKHLGIDPRAVKLLFQEKLIDEHDNLSLVYKDKWCNGCRIAAGVKKCKTLRVRHPDKNEEASFEMYILEPVSALKRKIAERWQLDTLHISLFCRGIRMGSEQTLQHYPLKNNMEIVLNLFQHRILIKVILLKQKRRVKMFVDDCFRTTVDDLLRYCAHTFNYSRQCSKGIFKDKCMRRRSTLAAEGVQTGDTVVVAFFDQPYLLQEGLINIFVADVTGCVYKGLGAVNSGVLLHAPKTASAPQVEETGFNNGPLPTGISVCDSADASFATTARFTTKSDTKNVVAVSDVSTLKAMTFGRKKEFLKKAKAVVQRIEGRKLSLKRQKAEFYLNDSDAENNEKSIDGETGLKTVLQKRSNISDIGGAREGVRGEIESDGPASTGGNINLYVSRIEYECKKIREQTAKITTGKKLISYAGNRIDKSDNEQVKTVYVSEENDHEGGAAPLTRNPYADIEQVKTVSDVEANEQEGCAAALTRNPEADSFNLSTVEVSKPFAKKVLPNDLSGCETETSGCESSRGYRPNIALARSSKHVDSDSSDIEHVLSRHGEDCQCLKCIQTYHSAYNPAQLCPYLQTLHRNVGKHRRKRNTVSESAVAVTELRQQRHFLRWSNTVPAFGRMPDFEPNADIETSGITRCVLSYVAKHLGKKWKDLLRKLGVGDSELDAIEHDHSSKGLHELVEQGLLAWKRGKGEEASLKQLLKALVDVGLRSVAEKCDGYATI